MTYRLGRIKKVSCVAAGAANKREPLLSNHMIMEMNCVGSLLILAIGLNLLGVTKIKVADYLPAILVAMLLAIVI